MAMRYNSTMKRLLFGFLVIAAPIFRLHCPKCRSEYGTLSGVPTPAEECVEMKKCKMCEREFEKSAKGPWCHGCVTLILTLLKTKQTRVTVLVETVERIRDQLRKAKAAGQPTSVTEIPGPYWGLDL